MGGAFQIRIQIGQCCNYEYASLDFEGYFEFKLKALTQWTYRIRVDLRSWGYALI